MAENLRHFMIELAQEPKKQKAYEKDAEAMMEQAGLSEEEKAALRSGDPERVRQVLGPPQKLPIICHVIYFKTGVEV